MMTFKNKEKKLEDYLEMAVSFNNREPEQLTSLDDMIAKAYEFGIRSSSDVNYDPQLQVWNKVANNFGFSSPKQMVDALFNLPDKEQIIKEIAMGAFPGLEGLYTITKDPILFKECDYANVGGADQLIVSAFYGGPRLKNWETNLRGIKITSALLIDEIIHAFDYASISAEGTVTKISDEKFSIGFESMEHGDSKKNLIKVFDALHNFADFDVEEDYNDTVWTITIRMMR